MKKIISNLPLIILLFSLFAIASCNPDPCKKVDCNNGTCFEGDCVCNPGFMGAFCDQVNPCHNVNCIYGTCVNGTCECEPGFTGADCSTLDPCYNITCAPTGVCLNGLCDCDPGYGGVDCGTLIGSGYIGTYNAVEVCASDPSFAENYVAEVKVSSDGPQYIIITNLYNHFSGAAPGAYQPEDTQVKVTVGPNGLDIPLQYWTAAGLQNFRVSGIGSVLTGTGFTIDYFLEDTSSGASDNCMVTYTLQ